MFVDRGGIRTVAWLLVGMWVGILAGCGAHRGAVAESLPRREAAWPELERVLAEHATVDAYRALVTVDVEHDRRKGSVRGLISFTPPRTFVVQGLDPLGRTLFTLSAVGEDVRLERPGEGPALVGAESIEAGLAPWMGSLRVADLLRLLGASHGVVIDPLDLVALERGEDRYTLYFLLMDGGRPRLDRKVFLERTRFLPTREEWFDRHGSPRARISLDRYEQVAGRWRPFMVTASRLADTLRIRVHELAPGGAP